MEERWLTTRHLGKPLQIHAELDSTNTHALALGDDPARHGLAVLARRQSAGRGQYGRSWLATADSSVLLSVLLFPPAALKRPVFWTAWAAVPVADLVGEITHEAVRIKWPNDVLVRGKKIAGILIEQRTPPLACVAGIGLNLNQTAFPDLPDAISLAMITAQTSDPVDVACRLLHGLDAGYEELLTGEHGPLESRWREYLGLTGRQVRVVLTTGEVTGRLVHASWDGILVDDTALEPEAIRQIHRAEPDA